MFLKRQRQGMSYSDCSRHVQRESLYPEVDADGGYVVSCEECAVPEAD